MPRLALMLSKDKSYGAGSLPLHEQPPLTITTNKNELSNFKEPWQRERCMTAIATTMLYEASANICWIQPPFEPTEVPIDECSVGDVVDAAQSWFDVKQSTAPGNRIIYPYIVETYVKHARDLDTDFFKGFLPLVGGRCGYFAN